MQAVCQQAMCQLSQIFYTNLSSLKVMHPRLKSFTLSQSVSGGMFSYIGYHKAVYTPSPTNVNGNLYDTYFRRCDKIGEKILIVVSYNTHFQRDQTKLKKEISLINDNC